MQVAAARMRLDCVMDSGQETGIRLVGCLERTATCVNSRLAGGWVPANASEIRSFELQASLEGLHGLVVEMGLRHSPTVAAGHVVGDQRRFATKSSRIETTQHKGAIMVVILVTRAGVRSLPNSTLRGPKKQNKTGKGDPSPRNSAGTLLRCVQTQK